MNKFSDRVWPPCFILTIICMVAVRRNLVAFGVMMFFQIVLLRWTLKSRQYFTYELINLRFERNVQIDAIYLNIAKWYLDVECMQYLHINLVHNHTRSTFVFDEVSLPPAELHTFYLQVGWAPTALSSTIVNKLVDCCHCRFGLKLSLKELIWDC